jgi:hypothetical protein
MNVQLGRMNKNGARASTPKLRIREVKNASAVVSQHALSSP